MSLTELYKDQISKLCEKHMVKSLYSFGPVNRSDFNSSSDIDLVVDISSSDPLEYTEHYFDLKSELEMLFKMPIDLLENRAIKNPFSKKNIDDSKVLVHGH